jgi:hypothetical protein
MELDLIWVFFSTVIYCTALVFTQQENLKFHRDEEIKRLKDRVKELESGQF